jgi:hypothetical protein
MKSRLFYKMPVSPNETAISRGEVALFEPKFAAKISLNKVKTSIKSNVCGSDFS